LRIIIFGAPIPLKRHRTSGKTHYDPQVKVKKAVVFEVLPQLQGLFAFDVPIKVSFDFHMPIPKSWSKKKKKEMLHKPHTFKPDISNLIKFYEDALNGVLWRDDSLISETEATKFYDENPRTGITIKTLKKQVSLIR